MKYLSPLLCALGLLFSLTAHSNSPSKMPLDQAYLEQWFSIDLTDPLAVSLSPISGAKNMGKTLRFMSDDGQEVNGVITYPKTQHEQAKLALVLHPMGTDQHFWWSDSSPLQAHTLTSNLLDLGYTVISLDARAHGKRSIEGLGPRALISKARSAQPRVYIDTIIGSVRDYRSILHWSMSELKPKEVLVAGYSMGAQMSLLLASYEPSITAVLAMVPPYVAPVISPVAPRIHVERISHAKVLWLAGNDDPYSTKSQTEQAFNRISSSNKQLQWFDAGHRLPLDYLSSASDFLSSLHEGGK